MNNQSKTQVYVGLGGNLGNTPLIFQEAITQLISHPKIFELRTSSLYQTSPISSIPQNDYINAVCTFQTTLHPCELLTILQNIEKSLGKVPKPKDAPRLIDLDILFFGEEVHSAPNLIIPHPRWFERLFVLIPLLDLTDIIPGTNSTKLTDLITNFPYKQSIKKLL